VAGSRSMGPVTMHPSNGISWHVIMIPGIGLTILGATNTDPVNRRLGALLL
jgi:hypothetical protein